MNEKSIIGIDPDSSGFQCALRRINQEKPEFKFFHYNEKDLSAFEKWINKQQDVIIAIEGRDGYCRPLEQFLRAEQIQFYSFSARQVAKAKDAYIGQHKTNEIDALAVADLALSQSLKGLLEKNKCIWFPKDGMRDLTRYYEYVSKHQTEETNQFWKLLRDHVYPVYAYFSGKDLESPYSQLTLPEGFIVLLTHEPDMMEWSKLTKQKRSKLLGRLSTGSWFADMKKIAKGMGSLSPISKMLLQQAANRLILSRRQKKELMRQMSDQYSNDPFVKALTELKGIGTIISTQITSEIIDIRRFANNNKLASYCGLGRLQHSTGKNKDERKLKAYNRRLKNAFMNAAMYFVIHNPENHLTGYYRNLLKKGMTRVEAYKRVARALVRKVYQILKSVALELEKGEEDVAKGSNGLNGDSHQSNTCLSPDNDYRIIADKMSSQIEVKQRVNSP